MHVPDPRHGKLPWLERVKGWLFDWLGGPEYLARAYEAGYVHGYKAGADRVIDGIRERLLSGEDA